MTINQTRSKPVRHGRNTIQNRSGATAVEFAIVAPVFFLLLIVSVEFGRLNVIRHTADQAAYEAARAAMVPGATADEAVTVAEEVLSIVGAKNPTIDIDPATLDEDTSEVTVNIDIPLNDNGYVLPKFTRNRTLQSRATLRTERVRGLGDT